jgi:hypothetical protein
VGCPQAGVRVEFCPKDQYRSTQKGKSGKMRSAFFVYNVFRPSHFEETIAANPLQYCIQENEWVPFGA